MTTASYPLRTAQGSISTEHPVSVIELVVFSLSRRNLRAAPYSLVAAWIKGFIFATHIVDGY